MHKNFYVCKTLIIVLISRIANLKQRNLEGLLLITSLEIQELELMKVSRISSNASAFNITKN